MASSDGDNLQGPTIFHEMCVRSVTNRETPSINYLWRICYYYLSEGKCAGSRTDRRGGTQLRTQNGRKTDDLTHQFRAHCVAASERQRVLYGGRPLHPFTHAGAVFRQAPWIDHAVETPRSGADVHQDLVAVALDSDVRRNFGSNWN